MDCSGDKMSYVFDGSAYIRSLRADKTNPLHWDVELVHEDKVVLKAHKALLAANSGLFKKTFSPEWIQAGKNKVCIKRSEMTAESIDLVLGAIYCEPFDIDAENVYDIHAAANFLEMGDLSEKCVHFLVKAMATSNVLSTMRYAKLGFPGSNTLLAGCLSFIDDHFPEIYRNPGFAELDGNEVRRIVSRRTLAIRSEVDVVDALVTWLNSGGRKRLQETVSLFDLIQWSLVDKALIHELASVDALTDVTCISDAERAAKLSLVEMLLAPQRKCRKNEGCTNAVPRRSIWDVVPDTVSALWVFDEPNLLDQILFRVYDLRSKSWGDQMELTIPKDGNSQDVPDVRKLFVYNGFTMAVTSVDRTRSSLRLHIREGSVLAKGARLAISAEDHQGSLQYIDGRSFTFTAPYLTVSCYNVREALTAVLVYDVRKLLHLQGRTTDDHLIAATLAISIDSIPPRDQPVAAGRPRPCTRSRAVFCGDTVWVIGGQSSAAVKIFSVSENTWTDGPRTHMSCCNDDAFFFTRGGFLYSAGGDCGQCCRNFEYIDHTAPVTGSANPTEGPSVWTRGPRLIRGCQVTDSYELCGRLHLIGRNEDEEEFVAQSIALDNFDAGWREETALLSEPKTEPVFVNLL